jgi:hypothetical protein
MTEGLFGVSVDKMHKGCLFCGDRHNDLIDYLPTLKLSLPNSSDRDESDPSIIVFIRNAIEYGFSINYFKLEATYPT